MAKILVAIAVTLFVAAILASPAAADTPGVYAFSGEVAGCEYSLSLDSGARQIEFETASCEEGALTTSAEAEYAGSGHPRLRDRERLDRRRPVNLAESLAYSSFTFGFDIEGLVEAVVAGAGQSTLEPMIEALAGTVSDRIATAAFEELAGGVFSETRAVRQVEEGEEAYCDGFSYTTGAHTNYNCLGVDCSQGCGKVRPRVSEIRTPARKAAAALSGSDSARGPWRRKNRKRKKEKKENEELCPAVNNTQKKFIFACLPTIVRGDVDTGSKPLVLLPGAVLIMLPVGGSSLLELNTKPTISSSASVISLGGVIAGYNAKVKAPAVALSAGVVDMANELTLEGKHVDLGSVDIHDLLGGAPPEVAGSSDLGKWISALTSVAALSLPSEGIFDESIFAAPTLAAGAVVNVKPKDDFTLGPTSQITATGRGGSGGEGANDVGGQPGGEAPGGAKYEYGGSHGGYGGYDGSMSITWEGWGTWQESQGRGPTFDDPFAPTKAGAGGSGGDDVARGANGGGAIRIDASQAPVRIEGRVDADGNGLDHRFSFEDTGGAGAGAGGSVYVTAKSLAGAGTITADGGGYCTTCINGFGGMGGGGRVALVYGEDEGWHGDARAHGGVDEQYPEFDDYYFAGTGGAGTVFTRQVKFKGDGSVEGGLGAFPDGTLTLDGGRAAGSCPPPDGTPIGITWSSRQRRLVLAGEARGYASVLDFGEIDVLGGSDLTTEYGGRRLDLRAGALKVDATSRVDMSSRGYGGGEPGYNDSEPEGGAAETAPGQSPAVRSYGGSHGGAGGAPSGYLYPEYGDRPGSTYDDPQNPALPGGGGAGGWDTAPGNPGGGVLNVSAGSLQLDGLLAADGSNNNGPTADDPTPFSRTGGAGAGGSVLVHAATLSGSGTVRADGGWACLTGEGPPLMDEGNSCNSGGSSGAGGGGRVAVYAKDCSWSGKLSAAGGIAQSVIGTDNAEQTSGGNGSTYFAESDASCPSEGGGASDSTQTTPSPPTQTTPPPRHRRAPRVTRLKLKGRALRLRVSKAGVVTVKLLRCRVKHTDHRKRHKALRCLLVKKFVVRAKRPGGVRVSLPRNLQPGRYRIVVSARDQAGDRGKALTRTMLVRGAAGRHARVAR